MFKTSCLKHRHPWPLGRLGRMYLGVVSVGKYIHYTTIYLKFYLYFHLFRIALK